MPMDGGFYGQVILDEDFKVISFFSFDKRAGLLVVDEIYLRGTPSARLLTDLRRTCECVPPSWPDVRIH